MERFIIAFVCTGNSCRSQMAEGFARFYGSSLVEAHSAGTHPAQMINPDAAAVMKERGVDISSQYPKLLEDIPAKPDILITMGCGVACPFIPSFYREDWSLKDPVGGSPEKFREVRDLVEQKIIELITRLKDVKSVTDLNDTLKKSEK